MKQKFESCGKYQVSYYGDWSWRTIYDMEGKKYIKTVASGYVRVYRIRDHFTTDARVYKRHLALNIADFANGIVDEEEVGNLISDMNYFVDKLNELMKEEE